MAAILFTDISPRGLQRSIAGPRAESYPHSLLCSCMSRYFYTYILIHTRTREHISSYIGLTDVHARVASHNFHSAPKTLQTHLFHATEHESRRSSSIVGDDRRATCAKHEPSVAVDTTDQLDVSRGHQATLASALRDARVAFH